MAVLLPFGVWMLVWGRLWKPAGGAEAFCLSWTALWGIGIILTELLGETLGFSRPVLAIAWLILFVALCPWWRHWRGIIRSCHLPKWNVIDGMVSIFIAGVLLYTLFFGQAVFTAGVDEYSYHLPRVFHWMTAGNLRAFPTPDMRQVILQPLHSYALLHVQVLTGSDRLYPLLSWFSLLVCLCVVRQIAKTLGLSRRGRLFSMAFALTNPMVPLQAMGFLADLSATAFLMLAVYFAFRVATGRHTYLTIAAAGIALGEAWLCKGTNYLFTAMVIPVCALIDAWTTRPRYGRWFLRWAVIGTIAVLLNAGFWIRNTVESGHPFGRIEEEVKPAALSIGKAWTTFARTTAGHFTLPVASWDSMLKQWVDRISDPDVEGWAGRRFALHHRFSAYRIPNGMQLLVMLLVVPVGFCLRRPHKSTALFWVAAAGLCYISLCAFLSWYAGSVRFQMPVFMFLAPVLAWALGGTWPKGLVLGLLAGWMILLPLVCLPTLKKNAGEKNISGRLVLTPHLLALREDRVIDREFNGQYDAYAQAMEWLPADPAQASGMWRDQPYHKLYPEALLWRAAQIHLNGRLPRLVHLWTPDGAGEPTPDGWPGVIFDERMDRRPPIPGYTLAASNAVLSVWLKIQ